MVREQLIVFTRLPVPGRTKTRLIPLLGPQKAAELQKRLTEQTLATARAVLSSRKITVAIHFNGGDAGLIRQWLDPENRLTITPQSNGDLGARMNNGFKQAFKQGISRAVLIGTDCPNLSSSILVQAFELLADNDLVLGPALDGGYYLIGLRGPAPSLFTDIAWGTDQVFSITQARAAARTLTVALLEPLADVDRPEDLHYLDHHSNLE